MRKLIAMIVLLAFMALYIMVAASLGSRLTDAPRLLQLVFYVIAGVAWVLPVRPLFRWMNTPTDPAG